MTERETGWSRADRAAAALQAHVEERGEEGYGDEGSDEFDEAVISLLVDLKHLLWRVGGPGYVLEDMVQTAINRWSEEDLPDGGDEDDEEDEEPRGMSRIEEEHDYKFGEWRL